MNMRMRPCFYSRPSSGFKHPSSISMIIQDISPSPYFHIFLAVYLAVLCCAALALHWHRSSDIPCGKRIAKVVAVYIAFECWWEQLLSARYATPPIFYKYGQSYSIHGSELNRSRQISTSTNWVPVRCSGHSSERREREREREP